MKAFSKAFIISFICFSLAIYIGSDTYLKENPEKVEGKVNKYSMSEEKKNNDNKIIEIKPKEPETYSNLEEAIERSRRVNFILLGMEDIRTDTLIFASFCPDTKDVKLINIPRDTYIHRKGYNGAEQRKINSIYGDNGIEGIRKTVSYILGDIPVHHHIILDYEGVKSIVDEIGGVEVEVPFHMKYEDPFSNPPLKIDIPPGKQILNGERSIEFLRYRKGNTSKEGYKDGDLGRIKTQQGFIKSFSTKASKNLITVVTKGIRYVKTDVGLMDGLSYGRKIIGVKGEEMEMFLLPGEAEFKKIDKKILSYYFYNKNDTKKLIEKIYNVNR